MKNGYRILDVDLHVIEPSTLWEDHIDPAFKSRAPKLVQPLMQLEVEGKQYPDWYKKTPETQARIAKVHTAMDAARGKHPLSEARANHYDPPSHIRGMDVEGIDIAFLYPTMGELARSVDFMDPQLASAICRAYNDWLASFCSHNHDRLKGVGAVPAQDMEAAALEVERVTRDLGFKAIVFRPDYQNGHNLNDAYFNPLYEALQHLNVPLAVHQGCGTGFPSVIMQRFYGQIGLVHALIHPVEMMIGMACLLYGGVLERFPKMRVAFLEAGASWLPFWLYRLDEHLEIWGPQDAWAVPQRPSEYFKRQCFISCDSDEEGVKYIVDAVGDDVVLFSSDYPHPDSKYPYAVENFLGLGGLTDDSKRKMLWDNGARFYGLAAERLPGTKAGLGLSPAREG